MIIKTVLSGHDSAETAYVIADYPFGFRGRCQKRVWLEYKPNKGYRLCSQTSNKHGGWNAIKCSTYILLGAIMYLDEKDYVQWTGISYYNSIVECQEFQNKYAQYLPEDGKKALSVWIEAKLALNKLKEKGEVVITITSKTIGTDGQVESKEISRTVCEPEKVLTT